MDYTFSDSFRTVLREARNHAIRLGHSEVLPGHMIKGLQEFGDGVLGPILARYDLEPSLPGATPAAISDPDDPAHSLRELPYSQEGRRVLEESMAAAHSEEERLVGLGHLMVGLDSQQSGVPASGRGARYEEILADVREVLVTDHRDGPSAE